MPRSDGSASSISEWVRSSARGHLARTGDPDYLAEIMKAARKTGDRNLQNEMLDAYNEGRASR